MPVWMLTMRCDLLSEFVELASEGKRLGYSMYCWISL
jgi:hypothetical protein